MIRALGVLYIAGGSLAILWVLLPHFPTSGERVTFTMTTMATMTIGTVFATGVLVAWAGRILRAAESRHRYQALHDPLTGLPNRLMFRQEAAAALARQADHPHTVAVAIIDLDRFKIVNDSFGHETGDELLKVVAARLNIAMRSQDLVARLGGDEFALLITETDSAPIQIEPILERVTAMWTDPIVMPHGAAYTSGSIGIAFSQDADDSPNSLLRDADSAMYQAKAQNPGGWLVFDDEMRVQVERIQLIDHHLRQALTLHQFHLVFQPVVELPSRRTLGAEVLLRWTHPDLGIIEPTDFIPIAEDTGMINPIGDWVLANALTHLASWRAGGLVDPDFALMVNVSGNQLGQGFSRNLERQLKSYGIPGSALGLEITETALLRAPAVAAATLKEVRGLGVQVLLDDFGTGYSSLAHLNDFPLNALKIDRSFVAELPGANVGLTEAVLRLGEFMSLDVIAEGVETEARASALIEMGARQAQGHLFGRPVPVKEFEAGLLADLVSPTTSPAPAPVPSPVPSPVTGGFDRLGAVPSQFRPQAGGSGIVPSPGASYQRR